MAKKVLVEWTDSTGNTLAPTHYEVERKTGSGGTYVKLGNNVANGVEEYDDQSAIGDATQYYYRVAAVFASGNKIYVESSITISGSGSTLIYQSDIPSDGIADFTGLNNLTLSLVSGKMRVERGGASSAAGYIRILNSVFNSPHNQNWILSDVSRVEVDFADKGGNVTTTRLDPLVSQQVIPATPDTLVYPTQTGRTNGSQPIYLGVTGGGDWTPSTDFVEISEVRIYKE